MPPTIFTHGLEYILTSCVLLVAQTVYVVFGFGSGLIAIGALALLFPDIKDAVVLLMLVNLPAEILVTRQSWRQLRWRPILQLGIGIIVGIPVGAHLLQTTSATLALTILGVFLVGVGTVFSFLPPNGKFHPPTAAAPAAGLLSGVLTGLFGTGGPPLIVWFHLSAVGKQAFRANLMAIFLLMTGVRTITYVATGLVTVTRLWSAFLVLPAVFMGAWIGHHLHVQISELRFQRLVSLLLAVLGGVLLLR